MVQTGSESDGTFPSDASRGNDICEDRMGGLMKEETCKKVPFMKRKWCDRKADKVHIGSILKKRSVGVSGAVRMRDVKISHF